MAQTPFSFLLRRLSSDNLTRYPQHKLSILFSHGRSIRPFSTSQPSSSDSKPSTLSSRMSFVFDQIDAVEREISDKDQTLQRIRAWRQSRKSRNQNLGPDGNEASVSSEASSAEPKLVELNPNPVDLVERKDGSQVELVHPWPEWIELIERLVQQKYFDVLNNEEDETETESEDDKVQESGIDNDSGTLNAAGLDRIKDFEAVQTACFNFGKDRFDILRSLSRQDIQILVGFGCPSANNRVTFSGKMLRKHAHLNEGDVCSSCSLRSSCARGFLVPKREDEARTADVMRVLSTFAFDPVQVNGSVENKSLIKQKSVRTVVRKLLRQIVKLSAVPIDPNLPRPVIRRPLPKVKKPPTPPKRRIGRDDVEMKRGDWHCSKCDFLNFAKNTICLQCDANQPKRQLLPGEWECSQCNYLNYRRNMVCFKCECKRPPDDYVEGNMQEKKFGARTNIENSNVWNFDFDDDESDGADVAAFEYGDSAMRESSLLDSQGQGGNYRDFKNGPDKVNRGSKIHEREYPDPDISRPGIGFDDFDDFDDVDNYEIETPDNPSRKVSVNDLSEDNKYSKYENDEGSENNMLARTRTRSRSSNEVSKPRSRNYAMSDSEEDDLDFHSNEKHTVHSNQRSSNVADYRQRRGSAGPSDGMSFGSKVFELGSDVDEDLSRNSVSRQSEGNKFGSGRRAIQSRRNSDDEDSSLSSECDGDDYLLTQRNRSTGGKLEYNRRGNFNGHSIQNSTRDTGIRSNGFNEDLYRSPRASHSYRHSESDNDDSDDDLTSGRNRSRARGGKVESSRRGSFKGCSNTRNSGVGYNGSSKDFYRPHQVSHGYGDSESDDNEPSHRNRYSRIGNFRDSGIGSNGFSEDFGRSYRGRGGNDGRKMNARGSGRGRGRGGFGKRQSGRFNDHSDQSMHGDFGEIRNSRRIIER